MSHRVVAGTISRREGNEQKFYEPGDVVTELSPESVERFTKKGMIEPVAAAVAAESAAAVESEAVEAEVAKPAPKRRRKASK